MLLRISLFLLVLFQDLTAGFVVPPCAKPVPDVAYHGRTSGLVKQQRSRHHGDVSAGQHLSGMLLCSRANFSPRNQRVQLQLAAIDFGDVHHVTLLVSDAQKALSFYVDILGMRDESVNRHLSFPGAFLRCGRAAIHLMELHNPDPKDGRAEPAGFDRHVGITVRNFDDLVERLRRHKVRFYVAEDTPHGNRALFCRDADMNTFEFVEDVHFDSEERPIL
mmetsp:Transcript_17431/g.42309  ORF Transcript_17431/g.42309 Transcript_17431/m.42309 type:complete len:220 (+) Transcript_17431:242-901(+)|eukprot:2679783-Rhodomonas_salina.1